MGLLDGKRLLITGVLNSDSIAYEVAKVAQGEGAEIVLTSFGRAMSVTRRTASRLFPVPDVLEVDVNDLEHLASLATDLGNRWDHLDGVLHAIAYGPASCIGGDFLAAPWPDVSVAVQTSAFSLKALAETLLLLMKGGGSIVGLDFDASQAWPSYNWMGVAKAALESTARYLARDLGQYSVRVNLVSAGPLKTVAARSIAGFDAIAEPWDARAPLGWDAKDPKSVARTCVALLSDWLPATTGEIIHADGGFHAVGM